MSYMTKNNICGKCRWAFRVHNPGLAGIIAATNANRRWNHYHKIGDKWVFLEIKAR
jgi:hypothetical protein